MVYGMDFTVMPFNAHQESHVHLLSVHGRKLGCVDFSNGLQETYCYGFAAGVPF